MSVENSNVIGTHQNYKIARTIGNQEPNQFETVDLNDIFSGDV